MSDTKLTWGQLRSRAESEDWNDEAEIILVVEGKSAECTAVKFEPEKLPFVETIVLMDEE